MTDDEKRMAELLEDTKYALKQAKALSDGSVASLREIEALTAQVQRIRDKLFDALWDNYTRNVKR